MTPEEKLALYFHEDRFIGDLPEERGVYSLDLGSKQSGLHIQLFIKISKNAQIRAIRYKIYGDHYTIALMAMVANDLENHPINTCLAYPFALQAKSLGTPVAFSYGALMVAEAFKEFVRLFKEDVHHG